MQYQNIRQAKAIESKNKEKLLKVNTELNENSGIYFLTRKDENGIKYSYIGQAVHVLTRLAQHLVGYQHIDLSLKNHGLYSETDNPYGWKIGFINCPSSQLDELEQKYILLYIKRGYQSRNKKLGGQCSGNDKIDEYRPAKGYRDGLNQGYKNASKEVSNLFDKYLNFSKKSDKPNKNQDKAEEKFKTFLDFCKKD